jgi:Cdc6-like AAA superfamily ATPase
MLKVTPLLERWKYSANHLVGLDEPQSKLEILLENSIKFGQSNSILFFGPPGSGKTTMVQNVLSTHKNIIQIRLDGLIHTTDKMAIKSIICQMMIDQDQVNTALLDYNTSLTALLDILHSKENCLPLVFILENIDGFCYQERQIILYNLFDAAQASKMTIIVIGITSFIDIMELFEKRGCNFFNKFS